MELRRHVDQSKKHVRFDSKYHQKTYRCTCMAVCVCDRNYESHMVQPANGNTQWYPVSLQCQRAKGKKRKYIPSCGHDLGVGGK
jgi:hypothetical protein